MRQSILAHVEPEEVIAADEHNGTRWVNIGNVTVFCPDPETAERIAAAFDELAEKMREAKRAEDGPSYGEVTDQHSVTADTIAGLAAHDPDAHPAQQLLGDIRALASHDPDDRR